MLKITFLALKASLRSRRQLALENIALRHQLEVLQRNAKRPRLRPSDRAFWAVLTRILPDWRSHLSIVQPDIVIRWHRAGWRLYWRWRSNSGRGRPKVSAEIRVLIRRMSRDNPLWGAPRIHGELLKLGYDICEPTIANYMVRRPGPPIQMWQTFIRNHMTEVAAIDFGERLHRELQRQAQGRAVERRDLLHFARGEGVDRDVAQALQSNPAAQLAGLPAACT